MAFRKLVLASALLLTGCSSSHGTADAGALDGGSPSDAGFDVGTHRVELDVSRLGRCEPDEEVACGCIDGFRRCDLCEDRCPTGWACIEQAKVCRALDVDGEPDGTGHYEFWGDSCAFNSSGEGGDGSGRFGAYCATGKVCAVEVSATGVGTDVLTGGCFPISFCKAAAVADPPAPHIRCVYSDGTPVINGPPPGGSCPEGDPREPYCGGPCGEALRCPDPNHRPMMSFFDPEGPPGPAPCVGMSETRNLGVCSFLPGRLVRGDDSQNIRAIRGCADWYGEPCAGLVTHPQLGPAEREQAYLILASVCRDYAARFPDSAECVDARWNPLP